MREAFHTVAPAGRSPALEELIGRVARGDQEAFARVYDLVAGPVLGLVRSVLRDPAQSEEVAQEAMVDIWRTAARFRSHDGPGAMAWILSLAHRRAVERVRGSQDPDGVRQAPVAEHFDQAAGRIEVRLEREQVRRCLAALTEQQRQAITLAYYRGFTYREVAELLKVPPGTVRTRLRDGLIRMRDCLGVAT